MRVRKIGPDFCLPMQLYTIKETFNDRETHQDRPLLNWHVVGLSQCLKRSLTIVNISFLIPIVATTSGSTTVFQNSYPSHTENCFCYSFYL